MGIQPETKYEFWQGIGKGAMILAYAIIGVIGKVAFDSMTGILSRKQIFWKAVLCLVVGVVAGFFCEAYGIPKWEKFIIPITTLFGDSIIVYIMKNWQRLLEKYAPALKNKNKTP